MGDPPDGSGGCAEATASDQLLFPSSFGEQYGRRLHSVQIFIDGKARGPAICSSARLAWRKDSERAAAPARCCRQRGAHPRPTRVTTPAPPPRAQFAAEASGTKKVLAKRRAAALVLPKSRLEFEAFVREKQENENGLLSEAARERIAHMRV